MMKIITVSTAENDVTIAANELLLKIAAEVSPSRVKLGVISYHRDVAVSGWIANLVALLPFPTIGFSTGYSAINNKAGSRQISLLIIAGENLEVACGRVEHVTQDDYLPSLVEKYRGARRKISSHPKLILLFTPFTTNWSIGDNVTCVLNEITGGDIPIFGSAICAANWDESGFFADSGVLIDGRHWADDFAFALIGGDIAPKFFMSSLADLPPDKPLRGKVTDADGYLLKAIDHVPPERFFLEHGEVINLHYSQLRFFGGEREDNLAPTAAAVFGLTPTGYLRMSFKIPIGAEVALLRNDYEAVMQTAKTALNLVAADCRSRSAAALIYSCVIRQTSLRRNSANDEMIATQNALTDIPFLMAYSGTEICPIYPTPTASGFINGARNCSFAAMTLA